MWEGPGYEASCSACIFILFEQHGLMVSPQYVILISVEEPCTDSEHHCIFGTQLGEYEIPCVPEEYVCDGVVDCFLGTDENCTGMQHHSVYSLS